MNRFSVASLAFVVAGAVVALSPLAANAQPTDFQPDQVRSEFIAHGYGADALVTWWTPDHVTTFRVSDPASDRVLMVLVYPDAKTADTVRSRAQSSDDSAAGVGPHLVEGYGYSTWRANVALVESTTAELERQYNAEQSADKQLPLDTPSAEAPDGMPTYAVDLDLIDVIDGATVNL